MVANNGFFQAGQARHVFFPVGNMLVVDNAVESLFAHFQTVCQSQIGLCCEPEPVEKLTDVGLGFFNPF